MAPGKENFEKTGPRSASLVAVVSQMACRWEKCGAVRQKTKRGAAGERRKQKKHKEKRKGAEELIVFFAVHRVSLTLPVDPGPVHMSAHLCAYVSTIT